MKAWFLRRAPREKLLLTAFVLLGALFWLSEVAGRVPAFSREWKGVSERFHYQNHLLSRRADYETRAAQAIQNLDSTRTLNAARLVAEINRIGLQQNLSLSIDSPRTETAREFSFHTVEVIVRRADLAAHMKFYQELLSRSPYLAIEKYALTADRQNGQALDARLSLSSVEVAR